ncbi:zonular occludens toxin domain-containing protein [Vibrio nitrifigilis]|uniref:Assembly protein n=1 Tax=Vibrio nitrifigilis TaxID=2789781 RepID=A0ABS0GGP5_9VIBR|nr:zonular occludens toxin domain-containing protein [Vibrio nitrifigilis]MBF9000484.1 assembly protein [Vibrio nitrifigilis]MBF9001579.1 assembly protein [Vibrio nitrifigilis]MBF9002641.1 assembly protein [Vibrio nitrifigilis]
MIYGIVGRPRSGKSYESVVYHIIPAIQDGRKVVTNVSLNVDQFVKVFGPHVRDLIKVVDGKLSEYGSMQRPFSRFEDYQDDWRDEQNRGPLFVVDEAHMVLPNRQLDSKILEFYSLHGHYGIDIVLLTQNLRKIHKDVKAMIEMTYYCAKNTAFGSDKTYTKKVRLGDTSEDLNVEQRRYKKEYFPFYQSHTQSSGAVVEAAAADVKPLWKTWPFIGAGFMFCLTIVLLVYQLVIREDKTVKHAHVNKVQSTVTVNTKAQVPSGSPKPRRKNFGPLADYDLFVAGYSKQVSYISRKRNDTVVDADNTFNRVYLDVYSGAQKMFTLNNYDLKKMGYEFKELASCVYEAYFHDSSRIVVCREAVMTQPDLIAEASPIKF